MLIWFYWHSLWQTLACSNIIHYLKRRKKYHGDLREDQEFIGRKNTISKYLICGVWCKRKKISHVYKFHRCSKNLVCLFFFSSRKSESCPLVREHYIRCCKKGMFCHNIPYYHSLVSNSINLVIRDTLTFKDPAKPQQLQNRRFSMTTTMYTRSLRKKRLQVVAHQVDLSRNMLHVTYIPV